MRPSQTPVDELSSSSLARERYSEPYRPAEPIVARVRPTAIGCLGAASDFLAFKKR